MELRRRTRTVMPMQAERAAQERKGSIVDNKINNSRLLADVYDSLIISEHETDISGAKKRLEPNSTTKSDYKNVFTPLCLTTMGLFGGVAALTWGLLLAARNKQKFANQAWKTLPEIARNMNLNKEKDFVTYMALQNPNVKNIIGALGFFVFASTALIAKNFADGFAQTWIKKREANIHRDLQKELIKVEAQTFSGKINMIRTMLSDKAKRFEDILGSKERPQQGKLQAFSGFINFKSRSGFNPTTTDVGLKPDLLSGSSLLVALTIAAMGGFTYLSMRNLKGIAKIVEKCKAQALDALQKHIELPADKINPEALKNLFLAANPSKAERSKMLKTLEPKFKHPEFKTTNKKDSFEELEQYLDKITEAAPEAFGGKPSSRPSYLSYIDDVGGHFYNWVVNFDSQFMASLFVGIAGISGLAYAGTKSVEAMRSAQVSKVNANTELELQKQLVEVELKNFRTKKEAAIEPLENEFMLQNIKGKSKDELKTMAANILYEVKNGPPYVYS